MQPLLYCCCGIDVHEAMIETCIIKGLQDEPEIIRKRFGTKPDALKGFAAYLMESEVSEEPAHVNSRRSVRRRHSDY